MFLYTLLFLLMLWSSRHFSVTLHILPLHYNAGICYCFLWPISLIIFCLYMLSKFEMMKYDKVVRVAR